MYPPIKDYLKEVVLLLYSLFQVIFTIKNYIIIKKIKIKILKEKKYKILKKIL